jgi:hypothetical protein
MISTWRKTLEATHFNHYVGGMNIHLREDQECPREFIFNSDQGFKKISQKWKIVNNSQHPIIFKQYSSGYNEDIDSLKHLLQYIDISENSGDIYCEISYHSTTIVKTWRINMLDSAKDLGLQSYDSISSMSWGGEKDFEITQNTVFKKEIEFKQSKILIPSHAESITIKFDAKIIGDLFIKNESSHTVSVCNAKDGKLIFLLNSNDLVCFKSSKSSAGEYCNIFDINKSVIHIAEGYLEAPLMNTPFSSHTLERYDIKTDKNLGFSVELMGRSDSGE